MKTLGRIALLDPMTVRLIAAGEVVEGPAAVVKELVENAVDAGAQRIHIELSGSGLERITVIDDGCGMDAGDAALAFERHATSKIRQAGDLKSISTLGFRGEALPSIGAVARVTLRTRSREAVEGVEIRVDGGLVAGAVPAGAPAGTTVTVADLFFNTPARLKFLRSASYEGGRCGDVAARLALSRPDISFSLTTNGRRVFATPGRGKLLETVAAVFGQAIAREMVPVTWDGDGCVIDGFTSRPSLTRGSRRQQVLILNGRYVKSFILAGAIDGAYRDLVPPKRHPVIVLRVTVDPRVIDVNVHPAKLEVKVADQGTLTAAALNALRSALGGAEPPSALDAPAPLFSGGCPPEGVAGWSRRSYIPTTTAGTAETLAFYSPADSSSLKPLGWLSPTYLLAEGPDGLYIIDQHAAHERVLYEKFLDSLSSRKGASQMFTVPVSLEFEPREASLLVEHDELLRDVGFIVESFGGSTFVLRGVPVAGEEQNSGSAAAELLRDFLTRMDENGRSGALDAHRLLAASMACHRAIRAGDVLDPAEAQQLLNRLMAAREPAICPHGRPTYLKITRAELARRFQRT